MAGSQRQSRDRRPSEYAREAFAEWGKATRYATKAATSYAATRKAASRDRPPLLERLNPAKTEKGGRLGSVADAALAKVGGPAGKLASKFSAGSRIVERMRDGSGHGGSSGEAEPREAAAEGNGFHGRLPIPIQESIEVAVPIGIAYDLFTRVEDYPDFLDRVESAERIDESRAGFVAKIRGRERELDVEIVDERPGQRLDWECTGEIPHSGVISFHELASRLTHIELTIELEPEGVLDRLTRGVGLTQRAIRSDLHRFKAYAELFEPEDSEPEPEEEAGVEDQGDVEDEDLEDEEEFDEDVEAEEDYEDEEELEDDYEDEEGEYEDEEDFDEYEEPEPVRAR